MLPLNSSIPKTVGKLAGGVTATYSKILNTEAVDMPKRFPTSLKEIFSGSVSNVGGGDKKKKLK